MFLMFMCICCVVFVCVRDGLNDGDDIFYALRMNLHSTTSVYYL